VFERNQGEVVDAMAGEVEGSPLNLGVKVGCGHDEESFPHLADASPARLRQPTATGAEPWRLFASLIDASPRLFFTSNLQAPMFVMHWFATRRKYGDTTAKMTQLALFVLEA
jgi:hypothetical protein